MKLAKPAGVLLVCMLVAACAKSFRPSTPQEQAIARTMDRLVRALPVEDYTTLDALFTPDASIVVQDERTEPIEMPWRVALSQKKVVLRATSRDRLVNFQSSTPQQASLETLTESSVGVGRGSIEKQHVRWELRQINGWHIQRVKVQIWTFPKDPHGDGP